MITPDIDDDLRDDDLDYADPIEPVHVGMRSFAAIFLLLWLSVGGLLWAHRELSKPLPWPDKFVGTIKPPFYWPFLVDTRPGSISIYNATAATMCYQTSGTTTLTNGRGASSIAGISDRMWNEPTARIVVNEPDNPRMHNDEWGPSGH